MGLENQKRHRKHPKRCTLAIYHAGIIILFVGILLTIVGISTSKLFHIYIYDHRKPAKFHNVHIPVGLFSISAKVTWFNMDQTILKYDVEFDDPRWAVAKAMTLIGLFAGIGALIFHIVLICYKANRHWLNVLIEVCSLLIAVVGVLIGLSLAESEIEYIHDHGDVALSTLLHANGLVNSQIKKERNQTKSPVHSPSLTFSDLDVIASGGDNGGEFALFLTPPLMSFFMLISADFLYLTSFLAVLIYFVRVCEKAEQARKQMTRAETSGRTS